MLDAMGVIYSAGDDVRDLLCPFVLEKGGTKDISRIERLYHLASLGNMSASEFWKSVGLDPKLEDAYLQRHKLTDGLIDFVKAVNSRGYEVWCLSNDLLEWSKKLRIRFGLDKYFNGFIISGDVGVRKPDKAIYKHLIECLDADLNEVVFVDDRQKNLDPVAALGFKTIFFNPTGYDLADVRHRVATTFNDILSLLSFNL